jgi:CheY-like chemotaxis protein
VFEHRDLAVRLHTAADGDEALAVLRQRGEHSGAARPQLILLDLDLPGRGGHEVLAEIKADPDLRSIPVVVLTTSDAEHDVVLSYDLHANAVITKPADFDRFAEVVGQIGEFYLGTVLLPPP